MYFDHGSYYNLGESVEPEEEVDQEFVQDVLLDLGEDQKSIENEDFEVLQDYFSLTNSGQHDIENIERPSESSLNEDPPPLIDSASQDLDNNYTEINSFSIPQDSNYDSNFANNSPHLDFNYQGSLTDPPNSITDPPNSFNSNFHDPDDPISANIPYDFNFSIRNTFIEDCYNGPPKTTESYSSNTKGCFIPNINPIQPEASNLVESPNFSINPNFNKRSTASVVPTGTNVSIFIQNQTNQYNFSHNFTISHASEKSVFNCSQSSFLNYNKINLSNMYGGFDSNGKAILMSQNSPTANFDRYLKFMVLANQHEVGKELKIIIFNFFREYLSSTHPKLLEKELLPLTRDEKRSTKLINRRMLLIKDHIIKNFNRNKKETLLPIVERYNEFVLMNHKKKGKKAAMYNLEKIKNSRK